MVRRGNARRKKKSALGTTVLLFGLFLLAAAGASAWLVLTPVGPGHETFVEITPGSSGSRIAAQLEQAGVVRSRYGFDLVRLAGLWKGSSLKAGEYRFEQTATVPEVYARIARGDVFTLSVTIPEGATRFEIAAKVAQAGFLHITKEDFLAASVAETPLIHDLDPKAKTLEGYLFPDTYRFQRKVSAAQVVSTMVRRFRIMAAQAGVKPGRSMGVTPDVHSTVTLASLVERETAVNEERPLVASVLANRLAKNMPLMTDPAVIYGLEIDGKWRGAIYQSDLALDTPYNTYRHTGLPPGPIANPGLPSLRAAANPPTTEYLYFVAAGADPQGKSRFAATLDEHNKNVASYRLAVKNAGGR